MKRWITTLVFLTATTSLFAANPQVEVHTNQGVITVELYEKESPVSVGNFLEYARTGFYDGTIFHRVIDGFMIQGGGFDGDMRQKPGMAPIQNEAKNGLKNKSGTLAMARTRDPHSASSQFFINLVDNASLDYPSPDGWGYAVFGKVSKGFDLVQKLGKTATGTVGPYQNVPTTPIVIESIRILDQPASDK